MTREVGRIEEVVAGIASYRFQFLVMPNPGREPLFLLV